MYIKNIEQEKILILEDEMTTQKWQIISKTLVQNPFVSVAIFAFSKGKEIGEHDSNGDAMVPVLEGVVFQTIIKGGIKNEV